MNSPPSSSDEASSSSVFDRLSPGVQRWIWKKGWKALHEIQELSAGPILGGEKDVLIAAPTAGGKTEAAFLPIVSQLSATSPSSLGCLCLSPLKALINDQHRRLESLCESAAVPLHRWHGDVAQSAKTRFLKHPRGVLLMTPESLEANLVRRGTQVRATFLDVAYVVIDELHAFIGNERGRQLQSLLSRLETVIGRRVPRIGLSATLGDPMLAAEFLRPGGGPDVAHVEGTDGGSELKVQIRGYRSKPPLRAMDGAEPGAAVQEALQAQQGEEGEEEDDESKVGDLREIAEHLFKVMRGKDNLIFANSRGRVEMLADILRRLCEKAKVPNEFLPHHGSLSKELREDAEDLLRDSRPGNVIATTTLEMGIDVGSIDSIAQVGVPPSVASLRQRLGRSGRREGQASTLRMYIVEKDQPGDGYSQDGLRASLVQTIAMMELLLDNWCEPPVMDRLHFSTLIQQTLALIAQYGGIRADELHRVLCTRGPFRNVDPRALADLLRELGRREFVSQAHDGTILLGIKGERIVDHYDFYAAFASKEEFGLVCEGRKLGSMPISNGLTIGEHIIFGGKRWKVLDVDTERKVVHVSRSKAGRAPTFDGGPLVVHDRVRQKMFEVYQSTTLYTYLDRGGRELLNEGRAQFLALGLVEHRLIEVGKKAYVYPWVGDRCLHALELLLRWHGLKVQNEGISLLVDKATPRGVLDAFRELVRSPPDVASLVNDVRAQANEKYDHLLPNELLAKEYVARSVDLAGALRVMRSLIPSSS